MPSTILSAPRFVTFVAGPGAALLKYFADDFAPLPVIKVSKIGYGMGKKDFAWANCVRAMIGEAEI